MLDFAAACVYRQSGVQGPHSVLRWPRVFGTGQWCLKFLSLCNFVQLH